MSPERIWTFRVLHILDAIEKILRYTSGMTIDQFRDDERTIDAVIRNFLVVGEACRHVPSASRDVHPEIPWRLMEGMRHVLVHDYDTVRLDVIWGTIVTDLPPLLPLLRRMLDNRGL